MKKRFLTLLLTIAAVVSCAFGFSACEGGNPSESSSSDSSSDNSSPVESGISFTTLTVDGKKVYGTVSNSTTEFSFIEEVTVKGDATYIVDDNKDCGSPIYNKTVDLVTGDNLFYVLETIGNDKKLYTVTIRRRPMYEVSFNTNGGTAVEKQIVEEDSFAAMPETEVTKIGYTFTGWDDDFARPIISNKIITAKFEVKPEMVIFNFIATATGCEITGVKDKTVTEIVIPDYVTSITSSAFEGCSNLTYYTKGGLKYLGNSNNLYIYLAGVESKDITTASIDNGCKFIGSGAFFGCSSLTSVEIPDSVTSIGEEAFYRCSSLMSVEIPDGVTSISFATFYECSGLTSVVIPDGVTSIDNQAFYRCSSLTSLEIPDCVTSIGYSTFYNCSSLTSVVIPDSVTRIGNHAFSRCSSLTSVEIPDSVTNIANPAFSGCSSLMSITVNKNNAEYCSIDGNLYTKDEKTLLQYAAGKTAASFTIPDSVTSIAHDAFFGCSSLTSVVIPDGVTNIGSDAFGACNNLTEITIPDSVISIDNQAFYDCSSLTIYCEAESQPSGWDSSWNYSDCPVIWGYKE